jgi:asparagine synthase (glutamine-hydrolysing)
MCGICGFVKFAGAISEGDRSIVEKMNSKLFHRGPDAQEVLLFGNVALGFSRLSIIGLDNGMQPICNEDGSVVLVCNGEIFNYIELRHQLKAKGHLFKTSSDVEVIVHLYEDYGVDFLNLLNGQFAFVLYDKKKELLFCARDQMGIIPFYYGFFRNHFIFGSEIKSIITHPLVDVDVDLVGLDQVFTFAGLISPRTMFKDIHSLENGHYLTVDRLGRITKREYWDLIYPDGEVACSKPEEYYADALEEVFSRSLALRLRADVPVGFYLSGGLDSSAILMKVAQLAPGIARDAFAIDFAESQLSETQYQTLIAKKSNATLSRKTFYYNDISERLRKAIYHCECPIKETYNTASLSLSESVKGKGIKVILSGEGADEFFAGYVGFRFDAMRSMSMPLPPVSSLEKSLRDKLWGDPEFFYENNLLNLGREKRRLYSEHVNASFDEIDCLNHPVVNRDRLLNRNSLNKRSYIDYKVRLVDHLVSDHGDRMAMANSVEVRYPFLDKDLVEFSTTIPSQYKLNGFTEKYILKRMASRFVPRPVIEREKFGFVAPGSPYLIQQNIEYINDILSSEAIRRHGYFNPHRVEELKRMYQKEGFSINVPYESDVLITVITFGILLDEYFT